MCKTIGRVPEFSRSFNGLQNGCVKIILFSFTGEFCFQSDSVPDEEDTCPEDYNPGQGNGDSGMIEDICDICPKTGMV